MQTYVNYDLRLTSAKRSQGIVGWRSPSNIALVKYWGKHGRQLPRNPSLSLTLQQAATYTRITYQARKGSDPQAKDDVRLNFVFEGQDQHPFGKRVRAYLQGLLPVFPFLSELDLRIESKNTFPHSSGIASSASSMSALAMTLCQMEHELFHTLPDRTDFLQKASHLARLGSGSACRSIFSVAALWGAWESLPLSSDLHAIPVADHLHEVFHDMRDAILIVDQTEKSVSSRAGHQLMQDNPFAAARYQQARDRLHLLWQALRAGDLDTFGQITEAEALSLHGLMMTSSPPYLLLRPQTLSIIQKVQAFRRQDKVPAYFTLDAGPNVHLLYPAEHQQVMEAFIEQELVDHCQDKRWIPDRVGAGPQPWTTSTTNAPA